MIHDIANVYCGRNISVTVYAIKCIAAEHGHYEEFRVVNGQLKEINPYYDPSVLNEAVKLL